MKTTKPLTSVHDLHAFTRRAIQEAVALGVICVADVAVMGAVYGADDAAWLSDIVNTAFAQRHSPAGLANHAAMCRLKDAYHAAR